MGERGLPDGWKCLSSRYLARDPWHTVREESLELPDGRRIPRYYVWEYPEWVNIIARTEDGAFVMIRQYRHAAGETSFELPAGTCESSDADLLAAARRELLEETGFGGGRWRHYMTLSANPATHANRTHTFLAEGVSLLAPQSLDEGEMFSVHLMPPAEVAELLQQGEILQALMDKFTFEGVENSWLKLCYYYDHLG